MNKLTIIGNLVRSPEQRTTQSGIAVTTFTVAVNRRRQQEGQPDADFFRVTAWRQLGEICAKYLDKGRKVCVVGPVSVNTYTGSDGKTRASMEVTAEDVEFLSPRDGERGTSSVTANAAPLYPKGEGSQQEAAYVKAEREAIQNESKYVNVTTDDLPWEV